MLLRIEIFRTQVYSLFQNLKIRYFYTTDFSFGDFTKRRFMEDLILRSLFLDFIEVPHKSSRRSYFGKKFFLYRIPIIIFEAENFKRQITVYRRNIRFLDLNELR
ncbi:Uncharacterized protein XB15_00610 [Leptospira santarosai]|nr:Uncharacterized protein XB15_00610 [Leptospira santarosai]